MKKAVLPLLLLSLAQGVYAQEASESEKPAQDYNKWTIEFGGGINKVSNPLGPGFHVDGYNLYHLDLGGRYMFNTKFGLKLEAALDRLQGDDRSTDFETNIYSIGLEGVVNLGRIFEFETWTSRLNVLAHAGVGVGMMDKNDFRTETDHIGSFLAGLTGQIKLSPRVALFGDFTMTNSFAMQTNYDGTRYDSRGKQGFDGTLFSASVGINIALGSHEEHADWYVYNQDDKIDELEGRLAELETMMNDTDKDGVPDYLDTEPNTISGVAVDSKGRTIDRNNNGVPDELESYLDTKMAQGSSSATTEMIDLINGGYVNVYFDFDKDLPSSNSTGALTFMIKYLKDNPEKSAEIIGYADEVGNTEYNNKLSARRAANVKKIFTDAGIAESRLNVVGGGVDSSVSKDSKYARQTVRRVTLQVK